MINLVALLTLPRRWASLPLLVGASYIPIEQAVELGPFHFPVLRLLLAVGFARLIMRGERLQGRLNRLDWLMVAWAAWALISSLFHTDIFGVLVNRLGVVYNGCGIYFFLRVVCRTLDDVVRLFRMLAIILIPLSIEMLFERMMGHNLFSLFGGVPEISEIRGGKIRAQGPFAHSILAGTVGAGCLPLMISLWQQHRNIAIAGIAASCAMVLASASSGPVMSALLAIGALSLWYWRHQMRFVRWLAVLGYIGLDLVMKAPAYHIIARIDLTGSSTSWHRAALIDAALEHLSEWWLAGTDYTRHWMAYGVGWSGNHIDITNYYLRMGVDGGLPLMFLFIAVLATGFFFVGQTLRRHNPHSASQFMIWALGASLFSHAASFLSVAYFDQSVVFLYLTLAAIGSVRIHANHARARQAVAAPRANMT